MDTPIYFRCFNIGVFVTTVSFLKSEVAIFGLQGGRAMSSENAS